jgi:hypothetical protein
LAALYGGVSYINKLTQVISNNERELSVLQERVGFLSGDVNKQQTHLTKSLADGREELIREVTDIVERISMIEALTATMKESSYKYASQTEVRAVSDNYYKLRDDINSFKYDLVELNRKLQGGY